MTDHTSFDDLKGILRTMKKAHLAKGPVDAALRRDRLERAALLITENHDA